MNAYESSQQEGTDDEPTKSERRAEWEGFEFRVPAPGAVRVENVSYGDESDEHIYVVSVEAGIAFDCTCPAWEYHNPEGGCKHMVAVENQPAVTRAASSATETSADTTERTANGTSKQASSLGECSCPADEHQTGKCEHRRAVATDGGREVEDTTETNDSQNGTDCPECHANGTVTQEPQLGSDTIPTYVCANCDYSTFTPHTDSNQ